jgi:hypothetical protein
MVSRLLFWVAMTLASYSVEVSNGSGRSTGLPAALVRDGRQWREI